MGSPATVNSTFDSFKMRAEAVSAEVHHFESKGAALTFILELLRQQGTSNAPGAYAVWADCSFLDGLDKNSLAAQVPGLTFDVSRAVAAESNVGISQMDWALADTGTLVQDAAAVEKRLVSTLPNIHIALLATERIVANLPALLTKIHPNQSNYISFITGPSRTADIERVLTIGVHGPARLMIVIVDQLGGAN